MYPVALKHILFRIFPSYTSSSSFRYRYRIFDNVRCILYSSSQRGEGRVSLRNLFRNDRGNRDKGGSDVLWSILEEYRKQKTRPLNKGEECSVNPHVSPSSFSSVLGTLISPPLLDKKKKRKARKYVRSSPWGRPSPIMEAANKFTR